MMNLCHVESVITAVVPGMLNSSSREKREREGMFVLENDLSHEGRGEGTQQEKSEDEGDSERDKNTWQTSRH